MSIASEILQQAMERSAKLRDEQLQNIRESAETTVDIVKHPWRLNVEAVDEAVQAIRSIREARDGESDGSGHATGDSPGEG